MTSHVDISPPGHIPVDRDRLFDFYDYYYQQLLAKKKHLSRGAHWGSVIFLSALPPIAVTIAATLVFSFAFTTTAIVWLGVLFSFSALCLHQFFRKQDNPLRALIKATILINSPIIGFLTLLGMVAILTNPTLIGLHLATKLAYGLSAAFAAATIYTSAIKPWRTLGREWYAEDLNRQIIIRKQTITYLISKGREDLIPAVKADIDALQTPHSQRKASPYKRWLYIVLGPIAALIAGISLACDSFTTVAEFGLPSTDGKQHIMLPLLFAKIAGFAFGAVALISGVIFALKIILEYYIESRGKQANAIRSDLYTPRITVNGMKTHRHSGHKIQGCPYFKKCRFDIVPGQPLKLTTGNLLLAYDGGASILCYDISVKNLKDGYFTIDGKSEVSSFTMEQVKRGEVTFVSTGNNPRFKLRIDARPKNLLTRLTHHPFYKQVSKWTKGITVIGLAFGIALATCDFAMGHGLSLALSIFLGVAFGLSAALISYVNFVQTVLKSETKKCNKNKSGLISGQTKAKIFAVLAPLSVFFKLSANGLSTHSRFNRLGGVLAVPIPILWIMVGFYALTSIFAQLLYKVVQMRRYHRDLRGATKKLSPSQLSVSSIAFSPGKMPPSSSSSSLSSTASGSDRPHSLVDTPPRRSPRLFPRAVSRGDLSAGPARVSTPNHHLLMGR